MKYKFFKESIEHANSRGVGQFHLFGDTHCIVGGERIYGYLTTWRSYGSAISLAKSSEDPDIEVYNDSGTLIYNKKLGELYP